MLRIGNLSNLKILSSVNHKHIGLLYFLIALMMSLYGYMLSIKIRLIMFTPGSIRNKMNVNMQVTAENYYKSITNHGLILILWVVMPLIISAAVNFILPVTLNVADMGYPRINLIAVHLYLYSVIVYIAQGFTSNLVVGTGWTMYAPLSSTPISDQINGSMEMMVTGLHLVGLSSILGAINTIGTINTLRRLSGSIMNMNIFNFGQYTTAFLLLTTIPILAVAITLIIMDRRFNTNFYNEQGDPLIYQIIFNNKPLLDNYTNFMRMLKVCFYF